MPNKSAPETPPGAADGEVILLEKFLPYRLTILANQVAAPLAAQYVKRFDLSVPEWRCMAVIGRFPGLSVLDLVEKTAMDKVAVSRAVSRLESMSRVDRQIADDDRRRNILHLSPEGWHVFRQVIPFAKRIEQALLSDFSDEEREVLFGFIDRLSHRIQVLDHDAIP
jgi:DNA-binding MarR family transcriptional regulator